MIYAKINQDGTVAEFPYRSRDLDSLRPNHSLPEDVVKVDLETNRPATSWRQIANITGVEKVGGNYVATYTLADRYANAESMKKGLADLKKMHDGINQRTFLEKSKQLLSTYSEAERDSWNQQRQEAAAYQADNTASTPLLTSIAAERGIPVAELANKITEKAAAYDSAYGSLLGKYQKNRDILNSIDLENNTTWDSIDSIVRL